MVENILIRDSDLREVILLCTNGHFINNSTFIKTRYGQPLWGLGANIFLFQSPC